MPEKFNQSRPTNRAQNNANRCFGDFLAILWTNHIARICRTEHKFGGLGVEPVYRSPSCSAVAVARGGQHGLVHLSQSVKRGEATDWLSTTDGCSGFPLLPCRTRSRQCLLVVHAATRSWHTLPAAANPGSTTRRARGGRAASPCPRARRRTNGEMAAKGRSYSGMMGVSSGSDEDEEDDNVKTKADAEGNETRAGAVDNDTHAGAEGDEMGPDTKRPRIAVCEHPLTCPSYKRSQLSSRQHKPPHENVDSTHATPSRHTPAVGHNHRRP